MDQLCQDENLLGDWGLNLGKFLAEILNEDFLQAPSELYRLFANEFEALGLSLATTPSEISARASRASLISGASANWPTSVAAGEIGVWPEETQTKMPSKTRTPGAGLITFRRSTVGDLRSA
jgi:hypothetical protein